MSKAIVIVGEQGSGRHHLADILESKYAIPNITLWASERVILPPIFSVIASEDQLKSLRASAPGFIEVFAVRIFADSKHVTDDYLQLDANEFDYFIHNDYTSFLNVRADNLITYIKNNDRDKA